MIHSLYALTGNRFRRKRLARRGAMRTYREVRLPTEHYMKAAFPDAIVIRETLLGTPKSLIAVRQVGA